METSSRSRERGAGRSFYSNFAPVNRNRGDNSSLFFSSRDRGDIPANISALTRENSRRARIIARVLPLYVIRNNIFTFSNDGGCSRRNYVPVYGL